jgi:imidazolonepropionase-like amidohydrolase
MEDHAMRTFLKSALVTVAALVATANTGSAQTQSLVDLLVSQLGVTSEQATGGAGSIFNLAKQQLAPDEFSQIAQAVPGIDSMMSAAPTAAAEGTTGGATSSVADLSKMATGSGESGSMTGMASKAMGDAASTTGGTGAAMGNLGSLAGTFEQLGMSPDMVQKFVPVVLDYVNSEGGATAMKLLQGALL